MNDKGMTMYHGQATRDRFADIGDKAVTWLTIATIKEIKEAYAEFMQDLLLESQEAY